MIFPTKLKFAFVLWNDAHSPGATDVYNISNIDAVHGHKQIITSGWLLKDDDIGITLGAEYCGENDFRGITHIPRSMVADITLSNPTKPKRKKVVKDGGKGKEKVLEKDVERFKEMVS